MTQLDGLRGVAAVVVLFAHSAATLPALGRAYYGPVAPSDALAWWLTYTPLKLFTCGSEAVLIFFVLSGFVVTLPSLRFTTRGWAAYYPQRLIRLGLPFIAALMIGWITALILPRTLSPGSSPWLVGQEVAPTLASAVKDALLLNPAPVQNNPLWSIRFEIIFSVALPLYCLLAKVPRRVAPLLFFAAVATAGAALMVGKPDLAYLLLFAVGALLNPLLDTLLGLSSTRAAGSRPLALGLALIAAMLLIAPWLARPWSTGSPVLLQTIPTGLSVLGATGLVVLAVVMRPAAGLLRTAPVQFAGRMSFSLYLVHVPVLATVAFAIPDALPAALLVLALPLIVVMTLLFSRFVEQPSHRLAQRVGRSIRSTPRLPVSRGEATEHASSSVR